MKILAIETSCDDTSIALLEVIADKTKNYLVDFKVKVLADFISSQTKIHAPFGGVVPHLATRAHYRN